MENFYGDISKIRPEYLLKATPYTKETTINFSYNLKKDIFFNNLYAERSNKAGAKRENDAFDKKIEHELRDIENEYAKVSVLNITGYGGCGKTTYIHHLLWTNRDILGVYDVIDYEGSKRAVEPFIERIAHLISTYENITGICDFFDLVARKKILNVVRFQEQLDMLSHLSRKLITVEHKEFDYSVALEDYEQCAENESSFLSFLFFVDLLLLLFDHFQNSKRSPMVLVIDNSDSMSNLSEEAILLPVLKQFANDCTYFFASNLKNDFEYCGKDVKSVIHETKLLIIFTTRIVSIKRYQSIEPDWEKINGWVSIELPENYYDHRDIINKRIDYYNNQSAGTNSNTLEELLTVRDLCNIAYRNMNFMRLFNGNVRSCVERLCNILNEFSTPDIKELIDLDKISDKNIDTVEGMNGFFLSMILYLFKKEHIYDHKLGLSPCRKDGTISLSRIILTILRENENRCSIDLIFRSLVPLGFSENDICRTVWNLCEAGRDVWRRLLLFDIVVPKTLEDLQKQAELYRNGENDIEKYSELVICNAGLAYMEFVVPHFEFMLSRHDLGNDALGKIKYQALFSESSEQNISQNRERVVYRFEKKIDSVFEDVKDCCYNSIAFANCVMKTFNLNRSEYIRSTSYNYHTIGWDGEVGPKQSYESRLIFRHIGYIEKYRCYLLKKHENKSSDFRAGLNRRLVDRILKYIKLYQDSRKCFQTEVQNKAADELYDLAQQIRNLNYCDFETRIELNN